MPTWKPPSAGDRRETWTWIDDDGHVLGTIHRENSRWFARSTAAGPIGPIDGAASRREATAMLSYDPLTRTAQVSDAHRRRRGSVERAVAIRTLGFAPEPEGASYQEQYAGTTGELLSWAHEKKSPAQIQAEVDQILREGSRARPRSAGKPRGGRKKAPPTARGPITEALARELPRFEFIAHWLAKVTKKKEHRGPLGLYVRRVGKRWQVVSPVGGGTVTFETTDPARLFDFARRGQLGPHIRDAEEFRVLAHQRAQP